MPPSEVAGYMQGTSAGNAGGVGTGRVPDYLGRFVNSVNGTEANNMFSAQEAEKARIFNSAEAQKQRDYEAYMSNTAYSRAAEDMKRAGINPASLGGNGAASAASTPSGATAQGVSASGQKGSGLGLIGAVMDGIGMALKAKFMMSAIKNGQTGLDLKRFGLEAKKSIDAAKIADMEANTALRGKKLSQDAKFMARKLANEEANTEIRGSKSKSDIKLNDKKRELMHEQMWKERWLGNKAELDAETRRLMMSLGYDVKDWKKLPKDAYDKD